MNRLFTRDKSFYRTFFRLTCIIALQNVLVCLVNLADNVMIGAYSENAMSGDYSWKASAEEYCKLYEAL